MLPFERFEAWRLAHELAIAVYHVTSRWPADERFGLTSQARRAAVSIAANIAEGSARRGAAEFRRYLNMAIGLLAELACLLRIARDVGLLASVDWARLDSLRESARKRIWGLYASLRR